MPYCAFRADGKGSNLIAFQDEYVIFFLYPQMKQEREGGTEANRRQRKRKRENGNGGKKLKDEAESIAMVT